MLQFLKGSASDPLRTAPAIQPLNQHQINLPATGGFQYFLGFSPRRSSHNGLHTPT
jgi:hypothetical protein